MAVTIVVGLQWGDEGKGKMVDHLAGGAAAVARFSGGANAGHTVITRGSRFALHLLPSGLVRPGVSAMIGSACVMDPVTVLEEIKSLEDHGISVKGRLRISGKVNLTHPGYRIMENLSETGLGESRIGTTGRGIGPTYERKFRRCGIRLEDALNRDLFNRLTDFHTEDVLEGARPGIHEMAELKAMVEEFRSAAFKVTEYCADVSAELSELLNNGEQVIAEGAQGTLLDPDHGSYPFVTCGQCVSGAACTSLGFGPTSVEQVVGILKAYSTRVGAGPFPTEQDNETGERIRIAGHEFGTTTGRPRRCGWLDGVLAEYACRLNGCTSVTITLLDVLSGFDSIRICTAYEGGSFSSGRSMGEMKPVYTTLPAWSEDISGERNWSSLPENARNYVLAIERILGVPVTSVSTGPDREDVIWR
ncbi:adenylosuccinate synthase [Candidatus Fermentibacteria bacterium]|nr:MAG: adenylosuccinate synthase [Candidatus Fermentibacteria bacterium]